MYRHFTWLLFLTCIGAAPLLHAADIVSGITFFKRTVSDSTVRTTSSTSFVLLAETVAIAPPGTVVQVSVRFSAESRCTEAGSTAINWCEARILINGIEAEPVETTSGQDFAFDSTNSGADGAGSYEAHSMDRSACVRNTTAATQPVRVRVENAVTNLDGGGAPTFWIDDLSLIVEVSQGCTVVPPGTTADGLAATVR